MNYKGLVDPKDKPFGKWLPFEVQVKIMFWVECFCTMDKRKKFLRKSKGLPKCDATGLPQHLREDQWWNQVVVRRHVTRTSHCHHCQRIFDHKLSVSEGGYDMLFVHSWTTNTLRSFFIFYRLVWWWKWLINPRTWATSWTRALRLRLTGFGIEYPIVPLNSDRSWSEEVNRPIKL